MSVAILWSLMPGTVSRKKKVLGLRITVILLLFEEIVEVGVGEHFVEGMEGWAELGEVDSRVPVVEELVEP